jgi:hypothetical protein
MRALLCGLAAAIGLSAIAEARMHHPYRGHRITAQATGTPPLDGLTNPSGAYSFRKLLSSYAGPAARIRRASDNAEIDVNFLSFSGFTGAPWDEASALAHCAATNCFMVTRYDQSGNALHWTATAANQPQVIFACQGGLACLETTTNLNFLLGPSVTPATGITSLSAVANRVSGAGVCTWVRQAGTAGNRLNTHTLASTWRVVGAASGFVLAPAADGAWHAANAVVNGASSVINIDGTETTGTATGNTTAGQPGLAGAVTTTCRHAEEIYWDNYILTPAERSALIANQRAFWGF